MREQHLDLLALAARDQPLVLLGDGPGEVTCALVHRPCHLARVHTGAASRLQRAGVAVELAGSIAEEAICVRRVRVSTVGTATALQHLASWAGVMILVEVIGEVGPLEGAVTAGGPVGDWGRGGGGV